MRAQIYEEIYAREHVGHTVLASSGCCISEGLHSIFLKFHRLTKFVMVNQFKESNFCFYEKHKKLQLCLT